jgi:hypothetical protein
MEKHDTHVSRKCRLKAKRKILCVIYKLRTVYYFLYEFGTIWLLLRKTCETLLVAHIYRI